MAVEAASFKGVVPGTSTQEDVEKAWGNPRKPTDANGALVQLYSVKPFKRVEVSYADGKVSSIVIRFERSFPADAVAKQLDLAAIRPVPVSNEVGEILGLAYPERGVLFALSRATCRARATMKVPQMILEPISAEPFVLRAETTMESRSDLSRRDLEQALALEPDNARGQWLYSRRAGGDRAARQGGVRGRRGRSPRSRRSAVPRHTRSSPRPGWANCPRPSTRRRRPSRPATSGRT